MSFFKPFCTGLVALALLCSCSTVASRSQKLSLGMSKEQVTKVMGSNFQTVGAREGSQTGKVEVIRFSNDKEGELLAYFRDGRLVQWGDTTVLENLPN